MHRGGGVHGCQFSRQGARRHKCMYMFAWACECVCAHTPFKRAILLLSPLPDPVAYPGGVYMSRERDTAGELFQPRLIY